MHLEILGRLRAWQGEAEIPLGSPQQRAVLAMLVLREGARPSATRSRWRPTGRPRTTG
ncbi:hypothetical protein [Amycolatopsis sp. H20-H5]|uniref:hypothetical protein n=1 Tax=Amycolatopsis sp. H20-H5 TaxID=3046309 RepID=UPI002DBC4EE9|nr:hypothetical protein [Amycolatopsis sp. H20-H5]MEC3981052.1 hypothetical protein [Amycolatopsis sp. H20-H5]